MASRLDDETGMADAEFAGYHNLNWQLACDWLRKRHLTLAPPLTTRREHNTMDIRLMPQHGHEAGRLYFGKERSSIRRHQLVLHHEVAWLHDNEAMVNVFLTHTL